MTGWKGLPGYVLNEAGVRRDRDVVRLPYRLPDGSLYANRVVADNGRRWWEPGDGRPVIPFGLDRLEDSPYRRYRVLAVCEGESDALAVWAALAHHGVDVLGIPGAGTWKPEWRDYIAKTDERYAAVYAVGDGDDAGRHMNDAVVRDVPDACAIWLPEGDDARALVQRDGGDALLDLFAEADRYAAEYRTVARAA
jgi:hypothetical protein